MGEKIAHRKSPGDLGRFAAEVYEEYRIGLIWSVCVCG